MTTTATLAMAALALCLAGAAHPATAQPDVDRNLYQGALRQRGNELVFCIWTSSPTAALDRAVARDLAAGLLLAAEFYELDLPQDRIDENFQESLFIALADHCDVAMGVTLDWDPLPDWLTITASYYDAPYLMVVKADNPAATLADLPPASQVASIMFTGADMSFADFIGTLPAAARPKRLPYDTNDRALAHLQEGRVPAALVFGPSLYAATGGDPATAGLKVIGTAPLVLPARGIGAVLLVRDKFLQSELDRSIASLRETGAIDALVAAQTMPPEP